MTDKSINLFFAVPSYNGQVAVQFLVSFFKLNTLLNKYNYKHTLSVVYGDALVTRARNTLVATFLANKDFTHLMFIDSDIGFEAQDVLKMLSYNKDVVAATYPKKILNWKKIIQYAKTKKDPANLEQAGMVYAHNLMGYGNNSKRPFFKTQGNLVETKDADTGFIIIKRDVIEKIITANPELKCQNANQDDPEIKPYFYSIFDTMIDPETGYYLSEDFTFCRRWQNLGGKIWVDITVNLTHTGNYCFTGNYSQFFKENTKKIKI